MRSYDFYSHTIGNTDIVNEVISQPPTYLNMSLTGNSFSSTAVITGTFIDEDGREYKPFVEYKNGDSGEINNIGYCCVQTKAISTTSLYNSSGKTTIDERPISKDYCKNDFSYKSDSRHVWISMIRE